MTLVTRQDSEEMEIDMTPVPHPDSPSPNKTVPDWKRCGAPMNPDRTIALAADYMGPMESVMYADEHLGMFKFGLGYTMEDTIASKVRAVNLMRKQFGLKIKASKNGFVETEDKVVFAPVVFNMTFRLVADSQYRDRCADVRALLGGWMAMGENLFVKGTLGGQNGTFYSGNSAFLHLFLITRPGTRESSKLEFVPKYPLNCHPDGTCILSGPFYNHEDNAAGWIDGTVITYDDEKMGFQKIIRLVAMWPGRFYPLPKPDRHWMMM